MNRGNRHLGRDDSLSRPRAMVKLTALRPTQRVSPTSRCRFMFTEQFEQALAATHELWKPTSR